MLPTAHRLTDGESFRRASRGPRAGSVTLVIHLSTANPENAVSAPARVGFVVSKTVGNAVVRNRVKRRLRHLVRERLPELPVGSLMVVRALPAAAAASYVALGTDLDRCLARLLPVEAAR